MRTLVLLIVTTFIAQMLIGAVPPNEDGTTDVSSQRQRRLDRMAVDVGGLCLSARRLMYEEEYYRSITSTSLLIVPDAG